MAVAEDLLHPHIETLVADSAPWQTMLADDVVWELPFAPALGQPARLSGRAEVVQFAAWFASALVPDATACPDGATIGLDKEQEAN